MQQLTNNAVEIPGKDKNALCESYGNGVWGIQLWQINFPPIFSENQPNFQWWCLNIQIFDKVIPFQNFWGNSGENSNKKNCCGVVAR